MNSKDFGKCHSIDFSEMQLKIGSFRQFVKDLFLCFFKTCLNDCRAPDEHSNPVELNATTSSATRSSSRVKRKLWAIEKNTWSASSLLEIILRKE